MTTKHASHVKAPVHANDDILTMPLDELIKRVAQAQAHLGAIATLLPGLVSLPADVRKHSAGRFRDGEATALTSVLDGAVAKPALFESLAATDGGQDPSTFEVGALRDNLQRVAALEPLAEPIEALSTKVSDTRMHIGDVTRPVMLAAYDLVKGPAKRDVALRSIVQPALDFFSNIGKHAAEARAANKAAADAKTPAATTHS